MPLCASHKKSWFWRASLIICLTHHRAYMLPNSFPSHAFFSGKRREYAYNARERHHAKKISNIKFCVFKLKLIFNETNNASHDPSAKSRNQNWYIKSLPNNFIISHSRESRKAASGDRFPYLTANNIYRRRESINKRIFGHRYEGCYREIFIAVAYCSVLQNTSIDTGVGRRRAGKFVGMLVAESCTR